MGCKKIFTDFKNGKHKRLATPRICRLQWGLNNITIWYLQTINKQKLCEQMWLDESRL